jgi:hypothetical protein
MTKETLEKAKSLQSDIYSITEIIGCYFGKDKQEFINMGAYFIEDKVLCEKIINVLKEGQLQLQQQLKEL